MHVSLFRGVLRSASSEHIRSLDHGAISSNGLLLLSRPTPRFTAVASKSIRDRRVTGARIPASKTETAILLFADNLPATKVAQTVRISLDSASAIRALIHAGTEGDAAENRL